MAEYIIMSHYTEFVNEDFHSVFRLRPSNGNAAPLSLLKDTLGRILRRHPAGTEIRPPRVDL